MLISIREQFQVYAIQPSGVIHVGAHTGEEFSEYKAYGWGNVFWIEAQPELSKNLEKLVVGSGDTVVNAAIWNSAGVKLNLHITSNSESSSLLEFGIHSIKHPEIVVSSELEVFTETLDNVVPQDQHFDYLTMDIQGAELKALQGFETGLEQINWICTEVNKKEVYKGCPRLAEMDAYLSERGFKRCVTRMTPFGWGDALYIRTTHIRKVTMKKRLTQTSFLAKFIWLQIKSIMKQILKKVLLSSSQK